MAKKKKKRKIKEDKATLKETPATDENVGSARNVEQRLQSLKKLMLWQENHFRIVFVSLCYS